MRAKLDSWELVVGSYDDFYEFHYSVDSDTLKELYDSLKQDGDIWIDADFEDLDFCELVCMLVVDGEAIIDSEILFVCDSRDGSSDESNLTSVHHPIKDYIYENSEEILYSNGIVL